MMGKKGRKEGVPDGLAGLWAAGGCVIPYLCHGVFSANGAGGFRLRFPDWGIFASRWEGGGVFGFWDVEDLKDGMGVLLITSLLKCMGLF